MTMVIHTQGRRSRGERGFTLVELLVVVIIIGILAAVSVPLFMNQRRASWDSAAAQDAKNAQSVVETYMADHGGSLTAGAVTCTGGDKGSTQTLDDQTITCSPGVTLTVTPNGTTYKIEGSHENGTKLYTYDSSSDSSVQVTEKP